MLKCIQESVEKQDHKNREERAKQNKPVDEKANFKFPKQLLLLFAVEGKEAKLERMPCFHMFESAPHDKIAVAYTLLKQNGEPVYLILIYSVETQEYSAILQCDQEVVQMCTNGSPTLLIVGTIVGSLLLFDLKNVIDGNPLKNSALTYDALLESKVKDFASLDANAKQHYYNQCLVKFTIMNHSYICDGKRDYPHFCALKKLVFIQRHASGIS